MSPQTRLSKSDTFVLLGCVGIVWMILAAAGPRGDDLAKTAACQANLRQLITAWNLYADENNDRIVCGDAGECVFTTLSQRPWVQRDWGFGSSDAMTTQDRLAALEQGALFPYLRDTRLYRCPVAPPGETRSYAIVDSMNIRVQPDGGRVSAVLITRRSMIDSFAGRCVFLDRGDSRDMGGWSCFVTGPRWFDGPPIRHDEGTTLAFADGHTEYWKWTDPRTVEFGKKKGASYSEPQPGNKDIRRAQIAVWGRAASEK